MKRLTDLHTHSSASDGQYTPAELVKLAKNRGLEVLALTDHDTMDGTDEAEKAGQTLGLQVIRGVELSAEDYASLHILGYAYDAGIIGPYLEGLKRGREERKYRIIDFLKQKGVDLSLAEVERAANGGVIGRPHFAQVMVERGFVDNRRAAFDLYLDTKEFQMFDRGKPSAEECVKTLKSAGAKVSLAHPYQIVLTGKESLEELVRRLVGYGLDAIECYYPRHSPEQTASYLKLAEKYDLHVTGGSDFHGERIKPDIQLASLELDVGWITG